MRFGLLGLLQVDDGAGSVRPVAGTRQRVLLAALLVRVNRVVPAEELAEFVWGGTPPAAAAALRNQVMRLRRALGVDVAARITARDPGYVITLSPEELDVTLFEALHREAGSAVQAGRWREAMSVLDQALALWRGAALLDVKSQVLRDECGERLEQLRVQAMEWQVDAGMRLGRHEQLVLQLRDLVRQYPLREHLHGQLMLALHRCGRRAEALEAYQCACGVLSEELGTEPGTELQALHQRMLTADPTLAVPEPAPPASRWPELEVPRQLPGVVAHFAGRAAELQALTALLDQAGEPAPGMVVISAIGGTAGVGKTALAVQWAHQVSRRFPDGQLYVNLRGYDPDQPVPAADALARFLRALGVAGQDIPPEEDERAARYRGLLAGKRVLVVLDNAGSAEQVRPLLPGTPSCTVVVTSRDALAGLVARDGATRLDLDLLPLEDAVGLLRMLIGARVDAAPNAAAELAGQCCRLPLALRVAAELATSHPDVPLGELTGDLADLHKRLDLLEAGGDRRTAVRAVFSWSYRHLGADAARTFRLLGVHPGPDFEPYSVAALTGRTAEQARQMLDLLARAHLVHTPSPGRYGLHDLLHAYAREVAAVGDDTERREALTRLFDHYLGAAAAAMDTLFPAERHWRPRIPAPAAPVPLVASPAAALGWLDAERAALVAVTVHAAGHGWPAHATRLADTLSRYLDHGSHYPEAVIVHSCAQAAARQAGDAAAEAAALKVLGLVALHQGRYRQATGHLEQAVALFRQTGDRTGLARSLTNLGIASFLQGSYAQAGQWWQQSLSVHRDNGDQAGQSSVLGNLGLLDLRQGRYQQASERLGQSLALARQTGGQRTEFTALVNLGEVSLRQGAYQDATRQLGEALALARELSDRNHEASALVRLGEVCLCQGRHEQAAGHLQQALGLALETGDKEDEAEALNGLGEVLTVTGQPAHARARHAAALELASQIGGKYQQAQAHRGLARAHQAAGALDEARRHWQQALALYTDLGAPEADQVRAHLTTTNDQDQRQP
jgi:tetratricopeptide (TPR) repeat protein